MTADEFKYIIEEALNRADRIKCSKAVYVSNLKDWKDEIDLAIEAVKERE